MANIKEGDKAPTFTLTDKDGSSHTLGAEKSDYTVLYFYPKDDTPGCTLEAKEFSAHLKAFLARRSRVFGISGGSDTSKAKFCKKHGLAVPLLSDQDFTVARSYGAYGDKKFMGRSFKGIFRKTFVIDKAGKVVRVFDSVKPEGHAQEVLATLDDLRGGKKDAVKQSAAKRSSVKKVSSAKKGSSEKVTAKRVGVKKVASVKKAVAKKATPKRSTANSGVKRRR